MTSEAEPTTIAIRCPRCEAYQVGEVRAQYRDEDEHDPTSVSRFLFVRCPNCNDPFLLVQDGDWHYQFDYTSWGQPRYLYPAAPDSMDPSVPRPIADSYLEAQRALNAAGASTAAAIMCRRTVEGICAHLGAEGKSLHAKLKHLKANGRLDPRLHEWADHALRNLGNDAAHDVAVTISRDDARDALEFTRAIIEYLFVFEQAFQRFKERRRQASASTQTEPQS